MARPTRMLLERFGAMRDTAAEAVQLIKSNDNVFVQTAGATPMSLVRAMTERSPDLRNVSIFHMHTEGPAPYADEALRHCFNVRSFFVGANVRKALAEGVTDFIPCFYSDVPQFFRDGTIPIDVALVQVSPPDSHGFCSLGISVDATRAACDVAKHIIAQVNPNMPRTHGDGIIHADKFSALVRVDDALPELKPAPMTEVNKRIGANVASLVEDGATLQMGIGAIPDAVLACLGGHRDLAIHSEMFSDGAIPLIKSGVINNSRKRKHRWVCVAGFLIGTRELYDFVHDNPEVRMLDIQYVNDPSVIKTMPRMTAINSAIEVDITGQVCADSIGTTIYSGVGGQMDFIRGASLSQGGRPIIALPSTTRRGESKIASMLTPGAGVVTTRAHVNFVVTEYGIAELRGKSLRQRAKAMINIAHPDHRERLEEEAYVRFKASVA